MPARDARPATPSCRKLPAEFLVLKRSPGARLPNVHSVHVYIRPHHESKIWRRHQIGKHEKLSLTYIQKLTTSIVDVVLNPFLTMRLHTMPRTVLRRHFCPSVCLSVCLSNACIATKQKKLVPTFLYHIKERLS